MLDIAQVWLVVHYEGNILFHEKFEYRLGMVNWFKLPPSLSAPSLPPSLPLSLSFPSPLWSRYKREFGFTIPSRNIIVDDIRVRATARACSHQPTPMTKATHSPRVATVGTSGSLCLPFILTPFILTWPKYSDYLSCLFTVFHCVNYTWNLSLAVTHGTSIWPL